MRKVRSAYTLMEIVLVMAILVVLAAIAYPVMTSMYSSSKIHAASDTIRARWTETRSRALEERRAYRFAVKDNTGNFRVAPESAEYWSDADPADGDTGDEVGFVGEGTLPDGVYFGSGSANGSPGPEGQDWRKLVTFLPDGTAREDVEVTIAANGSRSVTLRLRAATGTAESAAIRTQPVSLIASAQRQ